MKLEDAKTVNDLFDLSETEEGQQQIMESLEKEMTSDPDLYQFTEQLGSGILSLYHGLERSGAAVSNNLENILSIAAFFQKLLSLPEAEARQQLSRFFDRAEKKGFKVSEADQEEIRNIISRKPDKYVQSLTKVTEKMFDGKTDLSEMQYIRVSPERAKTEITVPTQLLVSVFPDECVKLPKNMTPYDRTVMNGIFSIVDQQISSPHDYICFTDAQVYEAMNGSETNSPSAIKAVEDSITKQMMSLVTMDYSNQAKMKKLPLEPSDCIEITTNVLHLKRIRFRTGGQVVSGYEMMKSDLPPIYRYSKAVGQICSTPKAVLQIPGVSNTEYIQVLRAFLIRHIEHLKKERSWNPTLTYKTIFSSCCMEDVDPKNLGRYRKAIHQMLDYWQEIHYIKGYDVAKKQRSYYSVTVKV